MLERLKHPNAEIRSGSQSLVVGETRNVDHLREFIIRDSTKIMKPLLKRVIAQNFEAF